MSPVGNARSQHKGEPLEELQHKEHVAQTQCAVLRVLVHKKEEVEDEVACTGCK